MPTLDRTHLGVDVGGSAAKVALLADDGSVLRTDVHELPDLTDDPDGNLAARLDVLADAVHAAGPNATVAVATPGVVDAAHRRIVALPGKLPGLEGVDWGDALARRGTRVDRPVWVLNDGHAAVLGEVRAGAGRGAEDVAMLTLGTGVGGGVVLGGRLFEGRRRRAGQLGHLSLDPNGAPSVFPNPGSLEWHVGDAYAAARTGGRHPNNASLLAAVRRGDPAAAADWRALVRALAVGIASIVHAFDCERVVVGGGLAAAGRLLFEPLAHHLDEVEWRPDGVGVRVVAASLGRHSGSIGAALYGREEHVPMNFWLASANPRDVARYAELGVWRGVITNPAVVAAEKREPQALFAELVGLVDKAWYQLRDGPYDAMLAEAESMLAIDEARIGVKVPATRAGLGVLRTLRDQGARPMATVVPTATWLAYAAAAGAVMVAPYGGMLQRAAIVSKHDEVLRMQEIVDAQGYDLELCVGLYDPTDVPAYARAGVRAGFIWARDVERFFEQPLVDEACAGFADDWAAIDSATSG